MNPNNKAKEKGKDASFVMLAIVIALLMLPTAANGEDSLTILVQALDQTSDSEVQAALMRGILSGLAGRRDVTPPENWSQVKTKLENSDNPDVKKLTNQLAQVFGDREAARKALSTLQDSKAKLEERRSALRSLLAQQNRQVVELLEPLVDQSRTELSLDAIRAYSVFEYSDAPAILLKKYSEFTPQQQRSVIETLATRKSYARELLKAIKDGDIKKDDVPAYVARSLTRMLGDSFEKVYGKLQDLTKDKSELIANYKKLLTPEKLARADASRGRLVYEKTCGACHVLYGAGGKIGPELTGSNRANLDYILLNSLDPSYDVPEGYRMVVIETVQGRTLSGIVSAEDNQRVVLKTVEQAEVVIAKSDIEDRYVSPQSLMPDGQIQKLKQQEVLDLIKYLQTTQQVDLPR